MLQCHALGPRGYAAIIIYRSLDTGCHLFRGRLNRHTMHHLAEAFFQLGHRSDWCCHGPLWWKTLLSILWDTGERRGAIINRLPWSCLADGRLLVPAEVRKGKTRDKLYTLHADTVALCDQMRAFGHDVVIKWDRTDEQLVNRYRTLLKRAGLPHDRKHMFHCIRRSVASHAAACGADATAILDHADPSITRRYYLDPRIVPQPQAVDVLFRPQKSA